MSEIRGATTGEQGFLSIREVLAELVGEFGDITISKIRFLESRGLIHPERTPSGYRKFYQADVNRLRWILRQQRENFLPLKVIKRRLDMEDGRDLELPDSPSLFDESMDIADRDRALATVVSNIRQAAQSGEESGSTVGDEHAHQAIVNDSLSSLNNAIVEKMVSKPHLAALRAPAPKDNRSNNAPLRDTGDAGTKHPNHPSQIEATEPPQAEPPQAEPPQAEPPQAEPPQAEPPQAEPPQAEPPQAEPPQAERPQAEPSSVHSPHAEPTQPETAHVKSNQVAVEDTPQAPPNSGSKTTKRSDPSTKVERGESNAVQRSKTTTVASNVNALGDVWLSIDELSSAASTTVEAIAELEEFGFIASQDVGGIPCFDGDALIIAKTIIGLRAYGLEARHLKSVRHAAERDASLYGQVVTPLLRQRNPQASARAKTQLEELADKGSALYEQILRAELRRLGGG